MKLFVDSDILCENKPITIYPNNICIDSLQEDRIVIIYPRNPTKYYNDDCFLDEHICVESNLRNNILQNCSKNKINSRIEYTLNDKTIICGNKTKKFKNVPKKKEYIIYDNSRLATYIITTYSDEKKTIIITDNRIFFFKKKILDIISDWILFVDGTFFKFQNCSKPFMCSYNILFTVHQQKKNENHTFYQYIIGPKKFTIIKENISNICYVIKLSTLSFFEDEIYYILNGENPDESVKLDKTNIFDNISTLEQPNFISLENFDGNAFNYLLRIFGNIKEVLQFLRRYKNCFSIWQT